MEGKITLSRNSSGIISMKIEDKKSGIDFIEIELNSEDFTDALFGIACRPCIFKTRSLESIGKEQITEEVIIEIDKARDKKEALRKVSELDSTDGWEYSTYLGNQDSFFSKDDKHYVRTTRTKYT